MHLPAGQRRHVLEVDALLPGRGAWIATHWKIPLTWLCTSICSAVPSTDSATITSGFGARMMLSSTGISVLTSVILRRQDGR